MFTRTVNEPREKLSAEALANIAEGQIAPLVEKLFSELIRFDAARAELDTEIATMPPTARRQLGGINFAARAAQKWRAAILEVFTGMLPVTGPPKRPDFTAAREVLERMRLALETESATASGGAKGRRMYRAIGTVSGISGGLTIDHDDVVALLDNDETQKLVQSGALQIVTTTEV
jgi:hypothetical protein